MEEKLNQLLKDRRLSTQRGGWRCADEAQLAAYVDGTLSAKDRRSFEAHLADCKPCLEQVSFLVRAADWPASADVPPWLITKADKLAADQRRAPAFFGWRWATATVAAVLVVGFIVALAIRLRSSQTGGTASGQLATQQQSPSVAPSATPQRNPEAVAMASPPSSVRPAAPKVEPSVPLIRNGGAENHSPKILLPREGALVKRNALEVRWQTVADAVFYDVSIITESGETVMSQQTEKPSLSVPTNVQLSAGTRYFASVRAHLREGKTIRSSVVSFRVAD